MGEYEKAIESYRKAIELEPEFVPAHYGLGRIFEDNGLAEEANGLSVLVLCQRPSNKSTRIVSYAVLRYGICRSRKPLKMNMDV